MIREMKTNGLKTVSQIPEQDPDFLSVIHTPLLYALELCDYIQTLTFKLFNISPYFQIPDLSQVADTGHIPVVQLIVAFPTLTTPIKEF